MARDGRDRLRIDVEDAVFGEALLPEEAFHLGPELVRLLRWPDQEFRLPVEARHVPIDEITHVDGVLPVRIADAGRFLSRLRRDPLASGFFRCTHIHET